MNEKTREIVLQKEILEYVTKNNAQSIAYAVSVLRRILKNYETEVLIVDDSRTYRALIESNLRKLHVKVFAASNAKEALQIIEDPSVRISLALIDYEMPEMNGMELTMKLRASFSKDELAIIALSSSERPEIAEYFLKHGANDFINKPFTNGAFLVRINGMLELLSLFQENRERANKDFLTGAYNRRFFFESGTNIFRKNWRKNHPLAAVMLDIDLFKPINDTYGHDAGDTALKELVRLLGENLRDSDLLARFGGEEFAILIEEITPDDLDVLLERLRTVVEANRIQLSETSFGYTVSFGVFYGLAENLEAMLKYADEALYEAKATGRNRVCIRDAVPLPKPSRQ
jgi:diguanylate cyclase (GGDEF)-like protein